nr:zinc ribbon domain-containing protein [uncultured Aminipila sp.]
MRCVHCGKEVRNNVIFCIHCGRPVKLEYSHYACEFYESLSIWDKLLSIFSGFSSQKKGYKQDVSLTRTTTTNKNLKDTIKKKGNSIKELYDNYTGENSGKTKDEAIKSNIDETGTNLKAQTAYNDQDPDYLGLKDIKKIKDSAQKIIRDFSGSSKEEKASLIKIAGVILIVVLALITTFIDTTGDNGYSYDESSEVYEETEEYVFPENPVINSEFVDSINSCPLGSENLIIGYLGMLYDDTYQRQWYDECLYSLDEFQPYISQIEQIETDYNNNPNYLVYDQLIYIKKLWQELVQPIYENPENYEQQQIDDNLNEFSLELNDTCDYYLEDDF